MDDWNKMRANVRPPAPCSLPRVLFSSAAGSAGQIAFQAVKLQHWRRADCCCAWGQADEPLGEFMDYCTYGHMIDNVVLIVTGTLHERDVHVRSRRPAGSCVLKKHSIYSTHASERSRITCTSDAATLGAAPLHRVDRDVQHMHVLVIKHYVNSESKPHASPQTKQELLEKCNPLGMFDSIATLAVASSMRELYRLVLVDTPLAPYFSESLSAGGPRRYWCPFLCRYTCVVVPWHRHLALILGLDMGVLPYDIARQRRLRAVQRMFC